MIDPSERLAEIAAGRDLPGAKGAYWRFASIADPAKAFGWIAGERVRGTPSAVRAPPALLPRRAFIGGQKGIQKGTPPPPDWRTWLAPGRGPRQGHKWDPAHGEIPAVGCRRGSPP